MRLKTGMQSFLVQNQYYMQAPHPAFHPHNKPLKFELLKGKILAVTYKKYFALIFFLVFLLNLYSSDRFLVFEEWTQEPFFQ